MGLYIERGYDLIGAKQAIDGEIISWYSGAALDTFTCNVLGTMHRYACDEAAQLRFINGKVSNSPVSLTCGDLAGVPADEDPIWGLKQHTATECGKVHSEYTKFAAAIDLRFAQLKQLAASATSVQQIEEQILFVLYPHLAPQV